MFLRFTRRLKDGKEHRYWSIVENKRCAGGKVVQRPVLYLGEINDNQLEDWCRVIEAFDEGSRRHSAGDDAEGLGQPMRQYRGTDRAAAAVLAGNRAAD